ncbi:hypothetical protein [Brachyspira catarrhinii]|uniref:Uncharacterized protein n=1 Tax=Brachyspira catarrhinii TaxID=2528966 RepID=A0ABY2TS73_9SPIR|nr:hypothetical protein [Brachyspira catarrhinii]TKZ35288.1 hypothetical protein EZH24_06080 [Brachyspira catarrhinii]
MLLLLYAKAEAHTFFIYSENREAIEYVESVKRAFRNAGHRIAYSEDTSFDYYAIIEINSNTKNESLWILEWENVEVELKITITDTQKQYSIAEESVKGGNNPDKLANKIVKNILKNKYLK